MVEGGTELAPMSTTAELWVALKYSQGPAGNISTLLWLRTENFMDRGVDLEWLSVCVTAYFSRFIFLVIKMTIKMFSFILKYPEYC